MLGKFWEFFRNVGSGVSDMGIFWGIISELFGKYVGNSIELLSEFYQKFFGDVWVLILGNLYEV